MSDYGRILAEAAPILPGLLGRLLYHFDQARKGRRPALGWLLACELAIAIPMGFIGQGAADAAGLTGQVAFAVSITVSYLGPRVLEIAFDRYLADKTGGAKK